MESKNILLKPKQTNKQTKKTPKNPTMSQWRIRKEIKKYLETNENVSTTFQNAWDTAKTVLKGKFIVILVLETIHNHWIPGFLVTGNVFTYPRLFYCALELVFFLPAQGSLGGRLYWYFQKMDIYIYILNNCILLKIWYWCFSGFCALSSWLRWFYKYSKSDIMWLLSLV